MFWQSSNNRHYDSSADSDTSAEAGTTSMWGRSKQPSKHKRQSKSSQHNSSSWLPQWLTPDPPPPPKRSRHRKSSKSRGRTCRPKSKHGWGIVSYYLLTCSRSLSLCLSLQSLLHISERCGFKLIISNRHLCESMIYTAVFDYLGHPLSRRLF